MKNINGQFTKSLKIVRDSRQGRIERRQRLLCRWIFATLYIVFITTNDTSSAINWLAIVKKPETSWNSTSDCSDVTAYGLTNRQRTMCRRHYELMPVVVHSARQAALVCQQMFHDSRWNCSSINLAPNFTIDLSGGSREQAVVYALASASLAQAISRRCAADGNNGKCSCGRQPSNTGPQDDFRWGGCADNIQYGLRFSRSFGIGGRVLRGMSDPTKKRSPRVLMNRHNSQVGHRKLYSSLATTCKCHGVSGSCSMKTCWKSTEDLRTFGTELLKSYYTAVEVTDWADNIDSIAANHNAAAQTMKGPTAAPPSRHKKSYTDDDLVYYSKSSDFCLPDPTLGSVGTSGRECDKHSTGSKGCQSMCCGRGYTTRMTEVSYRCDCSYHWCCYVKCKICQKNIEVNRCR